VDGRWLSFNLTHSGELALYAIARDCAVGVDVERIRHELAFTALMPDIFSPHEQAELAGLSVTAARLAFFHGWARKEAYLKARGEGLAHPPHSFEVSLLPNEPVALRLPAATAGADWSLYAIDLGPGYTAAVAAEGQVAAVRFFEHRHSSPNLSDAQ
jgi:4'-phosphopantetheinyl transferase